jgi:hypothetical protein
MFAGGILCRRNYAVATVLIYMVKTAEHFMAGSLWYLKFKEFSLRPLGISAFSALKAA